MADEHGTAVGRGKMADATLEREKKRKVIISLKGQRMKVTFMWNLQKSGKDSKN